MAAVHAIPDAAEAEVEGRGLSTHNKGLADLSEALLLPRRKTTKFKGRGSCHAAVV